MTNALNRTVRWLASITGLLFTLAAFGQSSLTLNIEHPDQLGLAGSTFTFQGTVLNNTGHSVATTDLFLNFAGFDPASITPHQILGDVAATFANGATSALVTLFSVDLAPAASPGSVFPVDVLLQDDRGGLADPRTVSVAVIPEPPPAALLAIGLASVIFMVGKRRRL